MQECVNEALYEYKTKSGLTVAECVERQIPKKPIEKYYWKIENSGYSVLSYL